MCSEEKLQEVNKKTKVILTLLNEYREERLTDEELDELFNRPEVDNAELGIVTEWYNGNDGNKGVLLQCRFDTTDDLRSQIAIAANSVIRLADFFKEQNNLNGERVIPIFDWAQWNESTDFILSDPLTRKTAVTAILAVISAFADKKE